MFHWAFLSLVLADQQCEPLDAAQGHQLVQTRAERLVTTSASNLPWPGSERSEPVSWQPFRYFPALHLRQPDPSCPKIGRQYPELVSRNKSILTRYATIVCDSNSSDNFLTDPAVPMTADLAELQGGCINMNRWPSRMLATNGSHSAELGRTCGESCDRNLSNLIPVVVDSDVLVISSTKLPTGMEYQHMLMDFLPPAWTVSKKLKRPSSPKLLTHIPLQSEIMKFLGVPQENILEIAFPEEGRFLLCTRPNKTLFLWRAGRSDGASLPMKNDIGGFTDFWHRLLDFRVAPELSNALARSAHMAPRQDVGQVTFLHRCVERRQLVNEDEALAVTSKALIDANRPEELVSMCAGRRTWLEQFSEIRKSALLVGAHGGSMANAVFASHSAGIIEIVNSPEAHNATEPGHWYGGAGAALSFFRVVLYERNAADELEVRTDDLEEALHQWFEFKAQLKT